MLELLLAMRAGATGEALPAAEASLSLAVSSFQIDGFFLAREAGVRRQKQRSAHA